MPEISVRNKISSIARIVISLRQSNMVGAKAVKILCFLCVASAFLALKHPVLLLSTQSSQRILTQSSQSLCGLCACYGKNAIFRCRIDRLRNLPCRGVHVEGARSQHVAALPRDCSEVKSRGVMREGHTCRGRTRAGPVRTPRAEGGAGTSRVGSAWGPDAQERLRTGQARPSREGRILRVRADGETRLDTGGTRLSRPDFYHGIHRTASPTQNTQNVLGGVKARHLEFSVYRRRRFQCVQWSK